ncbi:SDR family NAD(P)-dependent oxidoreductase [Streptomyces sp. NPDC005498]|uniref:SDR family NAD(P)-dependent oxidoreductase n=1 Tax=Streptomyces sp. NPDC005498 TaxID=3364717 RepID=UPI00368FDB51
MPLKTSGTEDHNRAALVTVADTGLGRVIAGELAAAGMTVYLGARSGESGLAVEREMNASGADAVYVPFDLDADPTLRSTVEHIEHTGGRLDVLVNMLGMSAPSVDADSGSGDGLRAAFDMGFPDAMQIMTAVQATLPLIRRSRQGRIVNVCSSFHAPTAAEDRIPTTAAEAATLHYATVLRAEGILVNAVYVDAETSGWGTGEPGSVWRVAADPVRLALLDAQGPTATSTGVDGVSIGLLAV